VAQRFDIISDTKKKAAKKRGLFEEDMCRIRMGVIYLQKFLIHVNFLFRLFFLFVFGFTFREKVLKFFRILPKDG